MYTYHHNSSRVSASGQEDVRKKLARDLHDGPIQALFAIATGIELAKLLLEKEPERAREELEKVRMIALNASREMRTLLFELRPLMLESRGLVPTLQFYLDRLNGPEGPSAYLDAAEGLGRLPSEVEDAVFAVAQEAIRNARKHSVAKNLYVGLRRERNLMVLTVADDGQGFDQSAIEANYAERGSFGLLTMRERAALIGATLRVRAAPQKGTVVTLIAPVPPEPSAAPAVSTPDSRRMAGHNLLQGRRLPSGRLFKALARRSGRATGPLL